MRKLTTILFMGITVLGTSCKKYLDINTNPNSPTSATPELVLPQALTATAGVLNSFNSYGMQIGGYGANAGGYGGFGTTISYNYSNNDYAGLWSATYDNLEDYQAIMDYGAQLPAYTYFSAAARIMKAYDFQLLVDAYNNIPYSSALKGSLSLTPTYDDAASVYSKLVLQLDSAITTINSAPALGVTPMGSYDVLFGGNMTKWKQFANTLKLRLNVRAKGKTGFSSSNIDASTGFLTADALINPGFTRDNGKQNPAWNNWAFGYTGSDATKSWVPSTFVFGFYDGHRLLDSGRGKAIYYQYPNTGTNKLGYESVSVPKCPSGGFWYSGTNRTGSSAGGSIGVLKGPNAGFPAMTAAESYFLQSEAVVRGIITGNDATLFNSGIGASFNYLYQGPDGTVNGDPATDAATYISNNTGSYLVNYSQATTTAMKLEAILTQKWIALNFVNSQEGWNEYRRTKYPTLVAGGTAYQTFASTVSESTRADKLPTRILYPVSEGSYNPANVPTGITPFTSLIFWAQ